MKKPLKDEMQRDAMKLSYTNYNGRTAMGVQYKAGYSVEKLRDNLQSEEPIYVAFEGEKPEELSAILEELRQFRNYRQVGIEKLQDSIDSQLNMITVANDRITELESKKKWWKRK